MPISLYVYLPLLAIYPSQGVDDLQNQNLLEIAFDDALERAKELDEYYEKHRKTVGPLHGLPVSLKDQFHVKGLETTMAYTGWIGTFEGQKGTGKERMFESELMSELNSLGAIVIAKVGAKIHTISFNAKMGFRQLWCGVSG